MCERVSEEDDSAMVFVSSELGEHSITTRDIDVNENTIIQFEVHKHHLDFVFQSNNDSYSMKTQTMARLHHLYCVY